MFVRGSDYSCATHLSLAIFIAFGTAAARIIVQIPAVRRNTDGGCISRRHAERRWEGNHLIVWLMDLPSGKLFLDEDWTPNGPETENEVFIRLEGNTDGCFADLKERKFDFSKRSNFINDFPAQSCVIIKN